MAAALNAPATVQAGLLSGLPEAAQVEVLGQGDGGPSWLVGSLAASISPTATAARVLFPSADGEVRAAQCCQTPMGTAAFIACSAWAGSGWAPL